MIHGLQTTCYKIISDIPDGIFDQKKHSVCNSSLLKLKCLYFTLFLQKRHTFNRLISQLVKKVSIILKFTMNCAGSLNAESSFEGLGFLWDTKNYSWPDLL